MKKDTQTKSMSAIAPTPPAELLASLEKHNAAFTKLLSLIPSRYYLPVDQDEVRCVRCLRCVLVACVSWVSLLLVLGLVLGKV